MTPATTGRTCSCRERGCATCAGCWCFPIVAAAANSVRSNEPSSWWSHVSGDDYVMITTKELKASVEPLAALRRSQGMVVDVVDVEELYDEFTFGQHSPQAIHDFLQLATTTWERKPH